MCHLWESVGMHTEFGGENQKERDNLEDLDVDEDNSKITLKEIEWEGGLTELILVRVGELL